MTFHSPISLRLSGTAGVGFSETWVVTETGCEVLTHVAKEPSAVFATEQF